MELDVKTLIAKLNPICRLALQEAAQLCVAQTNFYVEVEHFLSKLAQVERSDLSEIIKAYDKDHFDWANQWENLCIHLNKEVKINNHDSTTEDGVFIGIEDDGSALIKTESGMKSFKSSEISIKGVY